MKQLQTFKNDLSKTRIIQTQSIEIEELWDMVVIARYPSKKAMLDMIMKPEYIESSIHRTAGLAGQLNIETK